MSAVIAALLCVAGGIGAALRFWLDSVVKAHIRSAYPLGTTLINVSGSLVLGLLTGLASGLDVGILLSTVGTGLLGGYTTFSTASVETVRLLRARRIAFGILNAAGMLVITVAVAALGLWLGTLIGSGL